MKRKFILKQIVLRLVVLLPSTEAVEGHVMVSTGGSVSTLMVLTVYRKDLDMEQVYTHVCECGQVVPTLNLAV